MVVIDSDKFITHLVWSGLVDKATCGELKAAIELCTVKDIYTKDDMVAMLTEIQTEIEVLKTPPLYQDRDYYMDGTSDCSDIIQQKIDVLEEQTDGNNSL